MNADHLKKILVDSGLSENEAKVYLFALSLGPTTILKISKAAEIKRTTIYSVIESLKKKGLISLQIKGFKKLYTASNPQKLNKIMEAKQQKLKQKLPEFMAVYNFTGSESFIKYYEGLEAVKSIYEDLISDIKTGQDYYVISNTSQWYEIDPHFFKNFLKKRGKLNIKVKMLLQDSLYTRKYLKSKQPNEQIKILPKGTDLNTNLVITPQKVVIQQLNPPIMAMVIENKSIIKMHSELFQILWASAK